MGRGKGWATGPPGLSLRACHVSTVARIAHCALRRAPTATTYEHPGDGRCRFDLLVTQARLEQRLVDNGLVPTTDPPTPPQLVGVTWAFTECRLSIASTAHGLTHRAAGCRRAKSPELRSPSSNLTNM